MFKILKNFKYNGKTYRNGDMLRISDLKEVESLVADGILEKISDDSKISEATNRICKDDFVKKEKVIIAKKGKKETKKKEKK